MREGGARAALAMYDREYEKAGLSINPKAARYVVCKMATTTHRKVAARKTAEHDCHKPMRQSTCGFAPGELNVSEFIDESTKRDA